MHQRYRGGVLEPMTLLLALGAAARLTRLAVSDTITDPVRAAVLVRVARSRAQRAAIAETGHAEPPTPTRQFLLDLLQCHWCLGFWITAATTATAYLYSNTLYWQAGATVLAASYALGWLADQEAP